MTDIFASIKHHFPEAEFAGFTCSVCHSTMSDAPLMEQQGAYTQDMTEEFSAEQAAISASLLPPPSLACANCKREALPGLTYQDQPLCVSCAPYAGALPMITTDQEDEALEAGGIAGGEYLDSLGKYDLADLSPTEWRTFLGKILEGYGEAMREAAKVTAPF